MHGSGEQLILDELSKAERREIGPYSQHCDNARPKARYLCSELIDTSGRQSALFKGD